MHATGEPQFVAVLDTNAIATAATVVWKRADLTALPVVDLSIGEYLRPEIAGIRRPEPAGDPDDWQSLAAAAFLGQAAGQVLVTQHPSGVR